MIIVRPAAPEDTPAIQAMHKAQSFGYTEPDWGKMLISGVVEVDGRIEMAAFLRKTSEAYLLFDPKLEIRKRGRIGQFLMLNRELLIPARRVGFDDVHCWLPPEIEKTFGQVLMHLGWEKPLWACYSRRID
jgi:hypothetical protein